MHRRGDQSREMKDAMQLALLVGAFSTVIHFAMHHSESQVRHVASSRPSVGFLPPGLVSQLEG